MAISIRNQNAEQLAREVASVTGESITQVIIHALQERLERLRGRRTAPDALSDIMAISKRCSALPEIDPAAGMKSSDTIKTGLLSMVIDTSALIAILLGEPETDAFARALWQH